MAAPPDRYSLLGNDHPNRKSTYGGGDVEDEYMAIIESLHWHKKAFEADGEASYRALFGDKELPPSKVKVISKQMQENGLAGVYTQLKTHQEQAREKLAVKWCESCRQTHFKALVCFWNAPGLKVEVIEDMMYTLGPNILDLINAMCVKLPPIVMKQRRVQKRASGGALSVRIEKVKTNDLWDESLQALTDPCQEIAPSDADSDVTSRIGRLLGSDVKEKVEVFVCGHRFYDSLGHVTDNENLLEISLLLVHAPGSKDNFKLLESPFGQSTASKCWELAFPQYIWQRLMDVLNLLFLCMFATPICHATHSEEPLWMEKWKVFILVFFSLRGMANIFIELVSMFLFSGMSSKEAKSMSLSLFFVAYVNIFTLISLLVELLSSYFGLKLVRDFYKPPGAQVSEYFLPKVKEFFLDGFLDPCDYPVALVKENIISTTMYTSPVAFAMLIFAKWCILMMTLLNFDKLSKTALPAWHAIRSSESIWFLVYLLMLTMGCMLAYYALPVPDIGGKVGQNWLDGWALAFTRIFRLTLMGDFDMWALEGVDDRISLPSSLRNSTIDIEHGSTVAEMHKALRLWVLILALVFPVVLLNVYVGIIGKVYEDAKNANIAIAGSFRIVSSFRLLLHRRFWKNCCCRCLSLDHLAKCFHKGVPTAVTEADVSGDASDQSGNGLVAFIRVPRELLPESAAASAPAQ